jgi:hypothetical protein
MSAAQLEVKPWIAGSRPDLERLADPPVIALASHSIENTHDCNGKAKEQDIDRESDLELRLLLPITAYLIIRVESPGPSVSGRETLHDLRT